MPPSGVMIFEILKKEGFAEILVYLYENKRARYSELKKKVKSETTLVRALKILTEEGLLKRRLLDEKYRPTEYSLTEKGEMIGGKLKELADAWEQY